MNTTNSGRFPKEFRYSLLCSDVQSLVRNQIDSGPAINLSYLPKNCFSWIVCKKEYDISSFLPYTAFGVWLLPAALLETGPRILKLKTTGFQGSRCSGGAPGLRGFGLETLSLQGTAQNCSSPLCFEAEVLGSPPHATLGAERTPLLFPFPGRAKVAWKPKLLK